MPLRFDWLEFREPTQGTTLAADDERKWAQEATRQYADGNFEGALCSWSNALRADKTRPEAWAGQAHCLVRLDEVREAQVWAAKACQLFPGVPVLQSARARSLAAAGLLADAMGASDQALELAERTGLQDAWLWLDRAACLLADGRPVTARLCLEKVRELRTDDPDWEQEIGVELAAVEDHGGALGCLRRVVELRADRPYAWWLLGRTLRRLGHRDRALAAFDTVARLNPNYPGLAEERRLASRLGWLFSWMA